MKKTLKYLVHYNTADSSLNRNCSLAACNIVDYFVGLLDERGYAVTVLSASNTSGKGHRQAETVSVGEHSSVRFLSGIDFPGRIGHKIASFLFKIKRFLFLLNEIHEGDTVLVYHSLELMRTVRLLKKMKHFDLILQTAEIYADVDEDEKRRKQELAYLQLADAYVFQTVQLEKIVNRSRKPFVINNGVYRPEQRIAERFDDGKIHCVYSGTLDLRKGSIQTVLKLAELLPSDFVIHVLGFGFFKEDYERFDAEMQRLRQIPDHAEVIPHKPMRGKEYFAFLQKCHIGLSTQNPDAAFNRSSFPSKILAYLSNGLTVFSVRTDVIEESEVGGLIRYAEDNSPEELASAIRSFEVTDPNPEADLARLSDRFASDFCTLLENAKKKGSI